MKSVWQHVTWATLVFAIGCGEDASKKTNNDDEGTDSENGTDDDSNGSDDFLSHFGECPEDHAPDAPALRVTGFVPTSPKAFEDIGAGVQTAVDSGSTIYLLAIEKSDDDTADGELGLTEGPDEDGKYSFEGESESLSFDFDGERFTSDGEATIELSIPVFVGDPLSLSMYDVVMEGEFEDDDHCAIGELEGEGPPSEWRTGGSLSGKLTVKETKEASIEIENPVPASFSLCAYFAYGLSNISKIVLDPDCEAEPEDWVNPPDAVTSDGEDAWLISADIAATAVSMK